MNIQQIRFIWERVTTVALVLLVILTAMHGPRPTLGQTIVASLILGIILELMPYRHIAPDERTLWNIRIRVGIIAIVGGFAFYVLPRL